MAVHETKILLDMEHEVRETPLEIRSSGIYKLSSDLTAKAHRAIRVSSDDVDLDLNGYTVRCLPVHPKPSDGSKPSLTIGIHAGSRKNVVVRNGAVTSCGRGLQANRETCGLRIEGVDFSGNISIGANLGEASGTIVRGCIFAMIAGDIYEAYATGLNAVGPDSVVEHNRFLDLYRQSEAEGPGEGVGVLVAAGMEKIIIRHNRFENTVAGPNTIGIWAGEDTDTLVTDNTFTNFERGVASLGKLTATNNRFLLREPLPDSLAVGANGGGVALRNAVDGYAVAFANCEVHDNSVRS